MLIGHYWSLIGKHTLATCLLKKQNTALLQTQSLVWLPRLWTSCDNHKKWMAVIVLDCIDIGIYEYICMNRHLCLLLLFDVLFCLNWQCSNCENEAKLYCCWSTSYCSVLCQKEHWDREHSLQCYHKPQTVVSTVTAQDCCWLMFNVLLHVTGFRIEF